jgi:hypothetical protein
LNNPKGKIIFLLGQDNMDDHGIGASFFDGRHGKNKELKGF